VETPQIVGLTPTEAVTAMNKAGLGFTFTVRSVRGTETPNMVVYQDPAAGSVIDSSLRVSLLVTVPVNPDIPDANGLVYGLYSYTLPESAYPLPLELDVLPPDAEQRSQLASCSFIGGEFTFVYAVKPGSVLILSQLGREIQRFSVGMQ
jgi:hypothetical protein